MAHTRHDVVVVGARPAGAATAMLLARAGLRVAVVDRSRYGADTLSTHALMRGAVLQLHRWGLLDGVVAAGTPPIRSTTFRYAEARVDVAIKPGNGVDALYAPRRTVLDPLLADAAAEAGADVRFGITVRDVVHDDRGRVCGVVGTDRLVRRVRLDAAVVVGADGARSTIARRVRARVERRGSGASGVVYGYWSDVDVHGYEWVFRPGACAGVIPTNDGQACVFAASTPRRIGRGGIDVLRRVLGDGSPETAAMVDAGRAPSGVRTFRGLPGVLRHPHGPGWALVGDAGYWKDPLTAHGLTDALRDAELLAHALLDAAGGHRAEEDALADYHARRNELSLALFEATDTIAAQRWRDDEIEPLLRRVSAAMADEVGALLALPTAAAAQIPA